MKLAAPVNEGKADDTDCAVVDEVTDMTWLEALVCNTVDIGELRGIAGVVVPATTVGAVLAVII